MAIWNALRQGPLMHIKPILCSNLRRKQERAARHSAKRKAMGAVLDLVQEAHSICELSVAQVGLQEPEQGQQQALEVGPPLVAGSQQQLGHQVAVAHQVQPGKRKPRHAQRLQAVTPYCRSVMMQPADSVCMSSNMATAS